jgi:hypothetical protein
MTNRISSFIIGKQEATDQILGATGFYIKASFRTINGFIISIAVFGRNPDFADETSPDFEKSFARNTKA